MSTGTMLLNPAALWSPLGKETPSGRTVPSLVGRFLHPARGAGLDQPSLTDLLQETWELPSQSVGASEVLTSRHYAVTVQRITALNCEEEAEDRPSDFALQRTLSVVEQAARDLQLNFPRAIVAVGHNRSLRLLWSSEGREVRLVVGGSPANKTYLYWESAGQHRVDYSVDGVRLARLLRWTMNGI